MAHDFNNLLAAILGNAELLRDGLKTQPEWQAYLDDVLHAEQSAKALVQRLLAFSRAQEVKRIVLDLRDSLPNAVRLLERMLGSRIAIDVALPEQPALVRVDPIQIEQVLVNLAINARDAMPNGGTLRLALDFVAAGSPGAAASRRVRLRVSDQRTGIAEEARERIFEPFFTTKPVGQGTGLGLALVFAAIQSNEGSIRVESALGAGTTFTIEFPEVVEDAHDADDLTTTSESRAGRDAHEAKHARPSS